MVTAVLTTTGLPATGALFCSAASRSAIPTISRADYEEAQRLFHILSCSRGLSLYEELSAAPPHRSLMAEMECVLPYDALVKKIGQLLHTKRILVRGRPNTPIWMSSEHISDLTTTLSIQAFIADDQGNGYASNIITRAPGAPTIATEALTDPNAFDSTKPSTPDDIRGYLITVSARALMRLYAIGLEDRITIEDIHMRSVAKMFSQNDSWGALRWLEDISHRSYDPTQRLSSRNHP